MGALIVLVVVVLAGLGVLIGAAMIGLERRDKGYARERAALTERADEVLDELFDGRPVVTFTATKATLARDTLIEGAGQRGYTLTSETRPQQSLIDQSDLVFTRQA